MHTPDQDAGELRRRGLAYLAANPSSSAQLSPEEALHELQVHQAELEIQNQELRDTQTALARARDRYFSLFHLAPVAYFVFDPQHRLVEQNLAAAELLGSERGRLHSSAFFIRVVSDDRQRFHDHLTQAFATGQRQSVELRLKSGESGFRLLRLESLMLPGEAGAEPRCLTTCMDLTDRRRTEEALRESELRFRQLAAATDHVFWIMAVKPEQMLYVSPPFETLWKLPAGAMHRNPRAWLEVVHEEDRGQVAAALDLHLRGTNGEHRDLEYRICHPEGSVRWILDSFRPIHDQHGRLIRLCAIARDITERKLAEEQRLNLERKLLETQKLESLGVMAGGIAHDFNNLLTGMLGNASLARLELAPDSPARHNLERIETACQRAADLCKQMLAYAGRGRFLVQPLDVNQVIRETTELMRFSIAQNALLKLDLAPSLPLVQADATQIRQVLMNLVINAGEAMGKHAGAIQIVTGFRPANDREMQHLRLVPDPPAEAYVSLEIRDTGCGMDADTLGRLFDPFFTTKFTGRGLGLAAVLGIVRGHGGGIKVTSEPGRGSVFQVFLPCCLSPTVTPTTALPGPRPAKLAGTVLLVDDQEVVREAARAILESFGLKVLTADDGHEAVALFRRAPARVHCVLLDLTMPRMGGLEAFEAMRRLRPDTPIVIMSGYTEQESLNRFEGKRLSGFLQKPFSAPDVWAVLEPHLGARKAEAGR